MRPRESLVRTMRQLRQSQRRPSLEPAITLKPIAVGRQGETLHHAHRKNAWPKLETRLCATPCLAHLSLGHVAGMQNTCLYWHTPGPPVLCSCEPSLMQGLTAG